MQPYERFFVQAVEGNYLMGLSTAHAQEIFRIYADIYPDRNQPTATCGQCRLRVCRELGKVYFDFKNSRKEK